MTTRKDLAQIAVRLLAMYLFIQSISVCLSSASAIYFAIDDIFEPPVKVSELGVIAMSIVPVGLWWGFCYWLWSRSPKIVDRMTAKMDQPDDAVLVHIRAEDLLQAGLMLFGVWLWITALSSIGSVGAVFASVLSGTDETSELIMSPMTELMRRGAAGLIGKVLIHGVLGAVLIFKVRGVTHLLLKLRDVGLKKPDDTTDSSTPHQDPPAQLGD